MSDTEKLQVITKSMELVKHSYRITSNCTRYPKKYRFSLVDRIQLKSMDIYENLLEANRVLVTQDLKERKEIQTKAILYCDELLFYIELSKEIGLLDFNSMEYWSKMVCDIKFMTIAWRKQSK